MTQAKHRPKQPELVKALLLDSGTQLLANGEHLSIGGVAELAGVTKGAVQHHFPTRDALVMALYEDLISDFQNEVADDGSGASSAWRYARAALGMNSDDSSDHAKALLVASVVERPVASKWAEWVRKDRREDAQDINKLIARLAADGLWLSAVLGIYELPAAERAALAQSIEQLAQGA